MSVKLVETSKFTAGNVNKTSSRVLAEVKRHKTEIQTNQEKINWDDGFLIIPAVCTNSNVKCKLITYSYSIVLCFGKSSPSLDSELAIPITIGTIPLLESGQSNMIPVYEACVFGTNSATELIEKKNVDETDLIGFRPMYPVYKGFNS